MKFSEKKEEIWKGSTFVVVAQELQKFFPPILKSFPPDKIEKFPPFWEEEGGKFFLLLVVD